MGFHHEVREAGIRVEEEIGSGDHLQQTIPPITPCGLEVFEGL
jgi:hypothetical protein